VISLAVTLLFIVICALQQRQFPAMFGDVFGSEAGSQQDRLEG
jgi:hypothetical protein